MAKRRATRHAFMILQTVGAEVMFSFQQRMVSQIITFALTTARSQTDRQSTGFNIVGHFGDDLPNQSLGWY